MIFFLCGFLDPYSEHSSSDIFSKTERGKATKRIRRDQVISWNDERDAGPSGADPDGRWEEDRRSPLDGRAQWIDDGHETVDADHRQREGLHQMQDHWVFGRRETHLVSLMALRFQCNFTYIH